MIMSLVPLKTRRGLGALGYDSEVNVSVYSIYRKHITCLNASESNFLLHASFRFTNTNYENCSRILYALYNNYICVNDIIEKSYK